MINIAPKKKFKPEVQEEIIKETKQNLNRDFYFLEEHLEKECSLFLVYVREYFNLPDNYKKYYLQNSDLLIKLTINKEELYKYKNDKITIIWDIKEEVDVKILKENKIKSKELFIQRDIDKCFDCIFKSICKVNFKAN